ncbi:hypothetical protein A3709_18685 [Halioglobus sp. HI00S01]|uniref:hypothetical protein n=1 Tax=Halioglobus sp. HI00S01 TaxID=1822214 RepID=UPI0007C2EB53|nr:hypothetical protein [Halioglobus sp. HI00S01]KZX58100.1 hypothetical protein A3709_18685 [Halioglobus sp. HI00S01]
MLTSPAILSLTLGAAGLGALRLGWRKPDTRGRIAVATAWFLFGACLAISVAHWGAEFGLSYGLAALGLLALIPVLTSYSYKPRKRDAAVGGLTSTCGHRWLTFLSAGPLAGIACCQLTLVLVNHGPGSEITRMAWAAVGFPTLWGLAAYVICMQRQPGRYALICTALIAACSLYLYLGTSHAA